MKEVPYNVTCEPCNEWHCEDYEGFRPFDYGEHQDHSGGFRRVIKITLLNRLKELGRSYCNSDSCADDPFFAGMDWQDVIYLSIEELKDLFSDNELEDLGLSRE